VSTESSGKPDAWKLARPVWGWGRGETPRPTPPKAKGGGEPPKGWPNGIVGRLVPEDQRPQYEFSP
jgi:hypothetical protein